MSSSQRVGGRLSQLEKRLNRLSLLLPPMVGTEAIDFTTYLDDPVGFVTDVLGMKSETRRSDGTPYQFEVLEAVNDHPRVAIQSGHGVGKTASLAMLSLWWLLSRPMSRVCLVAPQYDRQIRGVLFAELRKVVRRSKVPLPVEVMTGRANVHDHKAEWGVIGIPATEPDRIEGQHADGGLLLLMDETKGVSQEVFDALMGALTGGEDSRLVVASTPGGGTGPFYRACTDSRGLWKVVQLSAEDSSRVSPKWCEDRALEWGADSALYRTRVQGLFADASDRQLFGLSLLESAVNCPVLPSDDLIFGVDVARSVAGDMNCICVLRGRRVEKFILWRSPDLMATTQRVVHEAMALKPKRIRVDAGGVGAGVVDRLRQLKFKVEAVSFGGSARDTSRFRNCRAEMYWSLREVMERKDISIPDDDELVADLSAIQYDFDQQGRILLDPKDDLRRRLGRSPDRADALALAVDGLRRPHSTGAAVPFGVPMMPIGDWVGDLSSYTEPLYVN